MSPDASESRNLQNSGNLNPVFRSIDPHYPYQAAPHDLRRTFAKLAHKGRAALEQIQLSLGHATILTTKAGGRGIEFLKS